MTDANITFGTALRSPYDVADSARRIEELGYDVLGCGEHVSFYGDTANGFVSLSVAAGVTSRVRLLSAITLVPLYPAALLAKLGAALDVASNGRFMLGVGVGGEFPNEFKACGVPVSQRGSRTDDALEVVTRTWSGTDVTYAGRYTQLENFSLKPLPVQKPRPPIWVSGRKEAAMRRAARYGDGWLPYMYTPEMLAESCATIRKQAEDCGRDPADVTCGLFIFFAVHEDKDTAFRMAADKLGKQYSQDFSKLVHKYALAGDPDDCKARLREYVDAGARFVFVSTACPDDYVDTNLELMAREVMPALRRAPA
ncbi:MAG: LLM class flavin-dependent oxidoreductase [Gammaproteobacteria bacterium]|nr:LLM class flavin-dependent oxidoreductase [Gammaproteobacteria bacterium]MCP5200053.1 LLM class flavin-dependent oxidoreductase [Gammaproteobacteria bacterium]